MAVLENHCHDMVRQFQESYLKGRYQSTLWVCKTPEFQRVAEAFGIPAGYLLEVVLDTRTNAYPKFAFGRNFRKMESRAKPLEMEGT